MVEPISPAGATPVPGAASTSINKQSSGASSVQSPKKMNHEKIKKAVDVARAESNVHGGIVKISQTTGVGAERVKITGTQSGTMTDADLLEDFGSIPGFSG